MGRIARQVALASVLLIGCDRGVEANTDNLTHFASVASDLRRDARELELLAKKVSYVRAKLEQRKIDIAEHAYTEAMTKERDALLERLTKPAPAPVEPVEAGWGAPAPPVDAQAMADAVALHDQLFIPLKIFDATLRDDNDYAWWLEELGMQSAVAGDSFEAIPTDELDKAVEDCRTSWSTADRTQACTSLLANHLTQGHFAGIKKQRLSQLGSKIQRLTLIEQQFIDEAANRKVSAEKVMAAYGSSFDGLIIWGFPSLIVAVLVIVLLEGRRRRNADTHSLDTLSVVTVLLLVSAIIILGLGGKIQPEALGTLIGGISGYVLGKGAQVLASDRSKDDEKASAPPTPPVEAKSEAESEPEPKPEPSKPALAAAEPAAKN